jgi:hypothetical protein
VLKIVPQFIQIGRAFRDAQQPGSKTAIQTRASVPVNIAENNNKFHEALDEIEMEIVMVPFFRFQLYQIFQSRFEILRVKPL